MKNNKDNKDNRVPTTWATKITVHWGKILPAMKDVMSLIKVPKFGTQIIFYT